MSGYWCGYFSMPICMRDCSRVRSVCDSTAGRPPPASPICSASPDRRGPREASNGTSGLMPIIRSMPRSSTVEACMVRRSAPSRKWRPLISTGGYRPGSAALAWTAREIGTSSQPGSPKRTASPVSRSTATTNRSVSSVRKSLLRPRRVSTSRRKCSSARLSNSPVGTSPPKRDISSDQRSARAGLLSSRRLQASDSPGRRAIRRRYSPTLGRRKVSGRKLMSSLVPVMKPRHISSVPMRLARPAARKAPLLTPT